MLKAEERMELDVLRRHGASIRELAKATGRSRNTVRRYLRGGEAAATRKPAPRRPEKLDPFLWRHLDQIGDGESPWVIAALRLREACVTIAAPVSTGRGDHHRWIRRARVWCGFL
jgi:transposase